MKKNFNMIFAAAAAFAMVLSCSKEENPAQGTQGAGSADSLTPLTISATLPEDMTKVSFTPSYDGGKPQSLSLAWEAEDKLRVYNHDDRTQYADFDVVPGSVGQKTGYFTGDIFAATSYDIEVINGEVGYAEQTQPADGQTASLKYLASATGVTDLKAVVFTESSSVLAITALMPEGGAAGVTSVELSASEAIFSTGKTLTINLAQKGDAGDDGILHLFATLPVGDQQIAEGTTLFVRFNAPDTDHTVYTRYVELGAQTFEAGKLNTINVNASQSDKHAGLVSCDGSTAEKAYLIADKYQLQAMATFASTENQKYFELIDDINLDGLNWTSVNGKVNFEGNGWTISKLNAPLFDDLAGNVSNVTISGATVSGNGTIGILANTVKTSNSVVSDVTLDGCKLTSGATDLKYVGCLVGEVSASSTFDDCHILGTTLTISTNKPYVGGAFGYVHNADVMIGCTAKCTIDEKSVINGKDNVGGFVGVLEGGTVKNCEVSCPMKGNTNAGGFVGQLKSGLLDGNAFVGTISGGYQYSGGLIGRMYSGTVKNCYTTSGFTYTTTVRYALVGGLVGSVADGKIEQCFATGTVQADGRPVGGLAGEITGTVTIEKCYTNTAVEQKRNDAYGRYPGGFIGQITANAKVTISNCYVTGSVTGPNNYNGAFVGSVSGGELTVTDCYTKVSMSGNSSASTTIFAGEVTNADKVTLDNFIGWDISGNKTGNTWWYGGPTEVEGSYMGTEGTISAKAKEFGWDETIWDLSGDDPKLKWTLASNN